MIKKILSQLIFPQINPRMVNVGHFYRQDWMEKKAKKTKKGSKVLDAGAGQCIYRDLFSHCKYQTQDFKQYQGTNKGPQQEEWEYGKIDYACDITKIPVKDNTFDLVICTEVLEHVPEPIKVIKELSRITKKGGKLLLTAPLASGLHQEPHHYYGGYTPHFYKKFLTKFNMKINELIPTGGLFAHFAQECIRIADTLERNKSQRPLIRYILKFIIAPTCWKLDKIFFVPEFTIGYMVEAQKM